MAGPTLTEVLVRLHGAGRADTYGAAFLDVAQDHLLWEQCDPRHRVETNDAIRTGGFS